MPAFAHFCVRPDLEQLDVPLLGLFVSLEEFLDDFPPVHEQGSKRIKVKSPHVPRRERRDELSLDILLLPFSLLADRPAVHAYIVDIGQVSLVKLHLGPEQRLKLSAVRTRHVPFFFGAVFELDLNSGKPVDGRSGYIHYLLVPERSQSLFRKQQRISLVAGGKRIPVYLVREQRPDRSGRK